MHSPTEILPFLSTLKWNDEGLIPAIVQDAENGEVLMMAWMDEPALGDTIATGQTHFYSRSRQYALAQGGDFGPHAAGRVGLARLRRRRALHQGAAVGGACHEGYRSCFFRRVGDSGAIEVAAEPVFDAAKVYGSSSDR